MRKWAIFLFSTALLLLVQKSSGQPGQGDSIHPVMDAIIDWRFNGTIHFHDKPNGKIIDSIKNDSTIEDYMHITIFDQTENYFCVSAQLPVKALTKKGWIIKAEYIGAYLRHEKFPMDLILYKSKQGSDIDSIVIKNWTPSLLTIQKFTNKRAFVLVRHNNQTFSGWIDIDKLCANAYSTCN